MNKCLSLLSVIAIVMVSLSAKVSSAQEELPPDATPAPQARLATPNDHLTVTQWVRPKTPGVFKARVVVPMPGGGARALDTAEITLSGRGDWEKSGRANRAGRVTITGVEPGVYAMTVRAPGHCAVYAMHILSQKERWRELFPNTAEIPCSLVGVRQYEAITLPYETENYGRDPIEIDEERVEKLATQIRGNEKYHVAQTNGGMVGHVYAAGTDRGGWAGDNRSDFLDPAANMKVLVLRGGDVIATADTNAAGRFVIPSLQPGLYSLLTVGPDGSGAVGFELTPPRPAFGQLENSVGERFVWQGGGGGGGFAIQAIPAEFNKLIEEFLQNYVPPSAGIGAGGGGGGGAGGLGDLAALAALAAAAAAINNGGDGGIIVQPASPSMTEE